MAKAVKFVGRDPAAAPSVQVLPLEWELYTMGISVNDVMLPPKKRLSPPPPTSTLFAGQAALALHAEF
jgi:hypothetical protein